MYAGIQPEECIRPDHARVFEVELHIDGKLYGTGKGKTKKEAEQEAAKEALGKLRET